jgi:hypothetical protein
MLPAVVLAGLLPLVSGCVAAVVPLAAGAALVKTQADGGKGTSVSSPVASATARSDLRVVATSLTALPRPDPAAPLGSGTTAGFVSYALGQAEIAPGRGTRLSALLHSASDLRALRAPCGPLPAAVFLDLDPGRGTFDPLAPGQADPGLAAALASLRARGVRVVWFSRLGENFAAPARAALLDGGLDPAGNDELVLMRTIDERKQSRRDELAARYCPIAMLGDERADFDELYLYLRNPDSALALDAMIGRGWFLASPFAPPAAAPVSGATP